MAGGSRTRRPCRASAWPPPPPPRPSRGAGAGGWPAPAALAGVSALVLLLRHVGRRPEDASAARAPTGCFALRPAGGRASGRGPLAGEPRSRAALVLARRRGLAPGQQRGRVRTRAASAVPPEIDPIGFATEFLVALVPAILLEFTLMPQGRKVFKALGFSVKDTSRGYVDSEERTILQQTAFDFDAWSKHRTNPDRYIKTTVGLLGSPNVLKRLQGPLFFFNVISTLVLFYDTYIQPRGFPELSLPALPFTISSSALGLLLVFRVTNANNRYILARGQWGDILNVSRDLTQQASLWAKSHDDFLDFARWCPAFAASLMCHLRDPARHDLAEELRAARGPPEGQVGEARGLSDGEIAQILNRPAGYSAPHYVLHRLRSKIGRLGLAEDERLLMEANITRLINDMGACENILATPIPVGYTKHTTRFLFLWLALLPLALQSDLGIATVFGEQILAFGLLGIEDVGIQIEEPFAVLPIERICTKTALESQVLRKQAKDALAESAPGVHLQPLPPPDVKTPSASELLSRALSVF